MAAPVFTPLPTPPDREASPATFNSDADAFLGALPTFQTQGDTLGAYCETQANSAAASAAVVSSTITVYTSQATFDAATPSAGDLFVLIT